MLLKTKPYMGVLLTFEPRGYGQLVWLGFSLVLSLFDTV